MSGSCDIKTGLCTETDLAEPEAIQALPSAQTTLLYVTDPICSHCWAMEPAWRKLQFHYGEHLAIRHLYGGLLPGWKGFADAGAGIRKPADVAPHWAEVAEHYGQPINPSVWLEDPLDSSYPPSIAAHTARLLDPAKEERYLRRIREAVFLEGRNIARAEVLVACAADVGLDSDLFARLLEAGSGKAGFDRDRQEVRQLPVRGFPTIILVDAQGNGQVLPGSQPYARLEAALLKVSGLAQSQRRPDVQEALAAYGSGTTREFAELLNLPTDEAAAQLQAAGTILKGDLWYQA